MRRFGFNFRMWMMADNQADKPWSSKAQRITGFTHDESEALCLSQFYLAF